MNDDVSYLRLIQPDFPDNGASNTRRTSAGPAWSPRRTNVGKGQPAQEVYGDHWDEACNARRTNPENPSCRGEPARESLVAERASVLKILFGGSIRMEQTTKTITMKRLERVIRIHGASNAGEPARERRPPRIVEMRGASDTGALPRES